MKPPTLETIEVETGPDPAGTVIWLHGLGADGHDFETIVPELVRPGERSLRFVFPHAPVRPVTINGGVPMRAWYDVLGFDRSAPQDEVGARTSDQAIRLLIGREHERGISTSHMVLAGFSQGGAQALFTAARLADRLAGVIVLSGYLLQPETFAAERQRANRETPVLLAHGADDPVIPLHLGEATRDRLRSAGQPVQWHIYPVAHAVCAEEIADVRTFLMKVLP